jgi:hypothetical protein
MLTFFMRRMDVDPLPSKIALRVCWAIILSLATLIAVATGPTIFRGMISEGRDPLLAGAAAVGIWPFFVFVFCIVVVQSVFLYQWVKAIVLGIPGFVRGLIAFVCAIPSLVVGFFHGIVNFFLNAGALIVGIARAIAAMTAKDWLKLFFVLLGLAVFAGVLVLMWPIASDLNTWVDSKIGFKPDFMHALMIDLFLSYITCGIGFIITVFVVDVARGFFSSSSK